MVVAQLVRAPGCGPGGRRFESGLPPHFFAQILGKKHEAWKGFASYADRRASYILMLDEQSSQAQNVLHTFVCLTRRRRARHKVLHKPPFQTWHGVARRAKTDEAAPVFISLRRGKPFHSAMKHCSVSLHNMKHSLRSYSEKMKKWEFSVCNTYLALLY